MKRFATVVVWFFAAACEGTPPRHEGVADAGSGSPEPKATPNIAQPPEWQSKQAYVYSLQLKSSLSIDEQEPMVAFELASQLELVLLDSSSSSLQFRAQMIAPKFGKNVGGADTQFSQLAAELASPFIFVLKEGKLVEVQGPAGTSRFASSILYTIAAALQYSGPPTPGLAQWSTEEVDGTGPYQITYRASSAPNELHRSKQSYTSWGVGTATIAGEVKVETAVVSSKGLVKLSQGEAPPKALNLSSVEYEEHLTTSLKPSATANSRTKLHLTLRATKPTEAPGEGAAALEGLLALSPTRGAAPSAEPFDRERIGAFTFDTALRALEAAPQPAAHTSEVEPSAAKARVQAASAAFTAMTALLRTQPALVARAERKVRTGSPAARQLLDALGSAGTQRAQRSLVSIMNDRKLDEPLRRAAAFSLIRTPGPTRDTVEALKKHAHGGPLEVHALYGLGAISRRLRETGESAESSGIVRLLLERLSKAQLPTTQVHILRGIANSGDASALEAVKPWLRSPTSKVRAAAVDAIRLMPGEAVDLLLAEELRGSSPEAQLAAIDAMIVRDPSALLVEALAQGGPKAEKPATRLRAVGLMQKWLPTQPALLSPLREISTNDVNPQVREAAKIALAPSGG